MFKKKDKKYVIRSTKNIRLFKKWFSYTLLFSALIGISIGLAQWMKSKNNQNQKKPPTTTTLPEIDTKKLESLKRKQQFDAQIQEGEVQHIFRNLPDIEPSLLDKEILEPNFASKDGVDLNQEDLFKDILEDLEESSYTSIEDRVATYQPRLSKKIQVYRKNTKPSHGQTAQEFIEEFIENARKHGYELKLNDKLQVISVKKINQ